MPELTLDLRDAIIDIAVRAGVAIMDIYKHDVAVELKEDNSPLTAADRASHRVIVDALAALKPAYPCLSEESDSLPVAERLQWETYWLIDPLDGTKEFIKRNGEFTVNIALIHAGEPVLGVVYAPAIDTLFAGIRGLGAWRQRAEEPLAPIRVCPANDPVRVVGSRSHANPALADYLEQVGPHVMKPMGSSLKICLVAAGEADVYPRLGPTCEWDTAAAHAVLTSAGGQLQALGGGEMEYNKPATLLNPMFIAWGDGSRNWQPSSAVSL